MLQLVITLLFIDQVRNFKVKWTRKANLVQDELSNKHKIWMNIFTARPWVHLIEYYVFSAHAWVLEIRFENNEAWIMLKTV